MTGRLSDLDVGKRRVAAAELSAAMRPSRSVRNWRWPVALLTVSVLVVFLAGYGAWQFTVEVLLPHRIGAGQGGFWATFVALVLWGAWRVLDAWPIVNHHTK